VQRLVLHADPVALLLVCGEPVAARAPQRVAGERGKAVEGVLRPLPVRPRPLGAVRLARDVVASRAAAQGEAAVAAAGSLGDAAGVVDADAEPAFGEPQRSGAAGDAGADDRDVGAAVVAAFCAGWNGIFEPVRVQDVGR
jgi:hypothetical protein